MVYNILYKRGLSFEYGVRLESYIVVSVFSLVTAGNYVEGILTACQVFKVHSTCAEQFNGTLFSRGNKFMT